MILGGCCLVVRGYGKDGVFLVFFKALDENVRGGKEALCCSKD